MGKLKNALIRHEEIHRQLSAGKQTHEKLDPRMRGLVDSDEELLRYEMEFNDWLDKYEASFGDYL